jgi:ABC-type multidrug transport system fused ATPase/permease subunit
VKVDDDFGVRGHLLVVEENGSENQAKLQIRGLSRLSEKGVLILNDVHLDIPKGSILGIIGPSGSGKSTPVLSFSTAMIFVIWMFSVFAGKLECSSSSMSFLKPHLQII